MSAEQICREAASHIEPWECANEGTGTIDEMQDGYDHNEQCLRRQEIIAAIILRACAQIIAESGAREALEEASTVNGLCGRFGSTARDRDVHERVKTLCDAALANLPGKAQ